MVYEIDLGQHTLSINADLPSSDPAFQFHAELNVEWMAVDPSAIVRYRIANVEEAVSPDLLRLARGITRGFSIAEAAEAEDKINEELGSDSSEHSGPSSPEAQILQRHLTQLRVLSYRWWLSGRI
jgi:hypothetical protein